MIDDCNFIMLANCMGDQWTYLVYVTDLDGERKVEMKKAYAKQTAGHLLARFISSELFIVPILFTTTINLQNGISEYTTTNTFTKSALITNDLRASCMDTNDNDLYEQVSISQYSGYYPDPSVRLAEGSNSPYGPYQFGNSDIGSDYYDIDTSKFITIPNALCPQMEYSLKLNQQVAPLLISFQPEIGYTKTFKFKDFEYKKMCRDGIEQNNLELLTQEYTLTKLNGVESIEEFTATIDTKFKTISVYSNMPVNGAVYYIMLKGEYKEQRLMGKQIIEVQVKTDDCPRFEKAVTIRLHKHMTGQVVSLPTLVACPAVPINSFTFLSNSLQLLTFGQIDTFSSHSDIGSFTMIFNMNFADSYPIDEKVLFYFNMTGETGPTLISLSITFLNDKPYQLSPPNPNTCHAMYPTDSFIYRILKSDMIDTEQQTVTVVTLNMPDWGYTFESDSEWGFTVVAEEGKEGRLIIKYVLRDEIQASDQVYEVCIKVLKVESTNRFNVTYNAAQQISIYSHLEFDASSPSSITLPSGEFSVSKVDLGAAIPFASFDQTNNQINLDEDKVKDGTYQIALTLAHGIYGDIVKQITLVIFGQQQKINPEIDTDQFEKVYFKLKLQKATSEGRLHLKLIGESMQLLMLIDNTTFSINQYEQIVFYQVESKNNQSNSFVIKLDGLQNKDMTSEIWVEVQSDNITINQYTEKKMLLLKKGTIVNGILPRQYSSQEIMLQQQIEKAGYYATISFSGSSILLNVFLAAFLNILWEFMNDASLLIILSLVSIDIPGMVQFIQLVFLQFIYLDILQTDKWLPQLFYKNYGDDSGLNVYFEINSYGSTRAVVNLGSTFIYLMIQIGMVLAMGVFQIAGKYIRVQVLSDG
ncbi:hypothetical protein FGO68_gene6935 [Halteria grandinella]|uniref:Uncharacterized protein n=1 Tax=Halteria grandinella TaxID=5974 RepID=A0A8J8T9S8_HALGN|nr:hypothetical protein FGO68_gene6935 [Halteria grandinella]